jgi:hypothetical protein
MFVIPVPTELQQMPESPWWQKLHGSSRGQPWPSPVHLGPPVESNMAWKAAHCFGARFTDWPTQPAAAASGTSKRSTRTSTSTPGRGEGQSPTIRGVESKTDEGGLS